MFVVCVLCSLCCLHFFWPGPCFFWFGVAFWFVGCCLFRLESPWRWASLFYMGKKVCWTSLFEPQKTCSQIRFESLILTECVILRHQILHQIDLLEVVKGTLRNNTGDIKNAVFGNHHNNRMCHWSLMQHIDEEIDSNGRCGGLKSPLLPHGKHRSAVWNNWYGGKMVKWFCGLFAWSSRVRWIFFSSDERLLKLKT